MKLRIQGNSLRIRLQQREVASLHEEGRISESLLLGTGPDENLTYTLERYPGAVVQLSQESNGITIRVPVEWTAELAQTERVGVDTEVPVAPGVAVRVKVEKDYGCRSARPDEDDRDAFPNPNRDACTPEARS